MTEPTHKQEIREGLDRLGIPFVETDDGCFVVEAVVGATDTAKMTLTFDLDPHTVSTIGFDDTGRIDPDRSAFNQPRSLTVEKIANIFGVDESELIVGRAEKRQREREAFLANALTDDALQRINRGETTLDEVLLFGDGDA